ncbi:MAG TPA: DUF6671 family protein [Flavobacterium sp.]|jgi:hypothetical protein
MFQRRKLLIVTKHHKEQVIAPILEKELGVTCFVSDTIDTDTLGTFSGEIDRSEDALNTLRKKCMLGIQHHNVDLVVASEGSFGPHPSVFFAHADEELLMIIDTKNDLEIIAREISLDTNFNGSQVTSESRLTAFAEQAKFPSHALILKPSENNFSKIVKGITSIEELIQHFHKFVSEFGKAYVETDMRAMYNPTRMAVIATAAEKLVTTIKNCCPNCHTPGFSVNSVKSGLPCEICNFPTKSTLSFIYKCKKCLYESEEKFPHQKYTEDPMYCDYCNP